MKIQVENKRSSYGAYFYVLFGLLQYPIFAQVLTLEDCTSNMKRKLSSDIAYLCDFLGLLVSWSSTVRCTRSYLCPGLIIK